MKILVLTEYYPRAGDPARGVWAHRQALAARQAGAEIRVLVLHRPIPPLSSITAIIASSAGSPNRRRSLSAVRRELLQPAHAELDGLPVDYLRYLSPPRPWSYGSWGAWAGPWLRRRLQQLRRSYRFDLVHAHYALPAGDAVRRVAPELPLIVSVHGHDVFGAGSSGARVDGVLQHARLVLANSAGTAARCRRSGAREVQVVHLGTDLPERPSPPPRDPVLVTVAHLAARKHHDDVLLALATLRDRHPTMRYVIVGDGPTRPALERQAAALGLGARVEFRGALAPEQARAAAAGATLFVMPSVDEAFGVAYVEAMAAGVPAIGCRGESGPEEIAATGPGILLVGPRDPEALAAAIDHHLADPETALALRAAARSTVAESFTWRQCGAATVEAYRSVIDRTPAATEAP